MISYPRATINLSALKHNFARVKTLAPKAKVMSVIKANAYGHGAIEAAQALHDSDAFAVARLAEGIQLRQAGIKHTIVLLEGIHSQVQCQLAAHWQLSPVVHTVEQLKFIQCLQQPLPSCWIMVETGMHRLGIPTEQVEHTYQQLQQSGKIAGEIGLMTHFANADTPQDNRNQQQLACIQNLGISSTAPVSMANSAAICAIAESHQQWVRPGIMLYGASPFDDITAAELDLKPVMTVTAQLIAIEVVTMGDQIGYGGTWQAETDKRVGTVNIGYGDGYNRLLSNVGQVAIAGKIVPVLGRVSMDMICIDLSAVETAQVGQEVELWGQQIAINTVAEKINTIPYELLCQLNQRVVRDYHG